MDMPLLTVDAGTTATDACWMDIRTAAVYAAVPVPVLARAIRDGELAPETAAGRGGTTLLLHNHDVETWAGARESLMSAGATR
jgi:hypothetical protein